MPTIAIPRCAILKDLGDLNGNSLGDALCLQKLKEVKTKKNTHLCGLKAHKATSSCCYATAVVRNSDDSNGIRTRL
jgi:hypothetical protein